MKYLLVVLVVVGVLWLLAARRRPRSAAKKHKAERSTAKPAPMLACAHCGIHLPLSEAVNDAAGQVFCSEAHRLAGPR